MPRKAKEPKEDIIALFKQFSISVLDRLDKLENTINKPITSQAPTLREIPESPPIPSSAIPQHIPVPSDYRTLVDTILNKNFGIELEPHTDAPVVTAVIVVPDKYSTMTPAQKEIMPRDIRPKVMTIAGGVNELKEWVETVYRSFTPELQSMIVIDRTI